MPRPGLFLQRKSDGSNVAELSSAKLDDVEWVLNEPGALNFTMSQTDPKVKVPLLAEHEIQLRIDDQPMWQGPIWKCKGGPKSVQFTAEGLLSYFQRRYITNATQEFTSLDQFAIAFGLVNYAQSGPDQALRIPTAGVPASGVVRSRRYERENHEQIYELLQEFPNLTRADTGAKTGFDFEINPVTREFTPYYPQKGRRRANLVLEYGRNVTDYTAEEDAMDLTNRAYATGGSNGQVKFEQNHRDDASAARYGEMQHIFSVGDEKDVGVLAQRAADYVRRFKQPVINPGVSAVEVPVQLLGVIGLGDTMPVRIVHGRHNIAGDFRVGKIKWNVRPNTLDIGFIEQVA